jgi:hypothetical protein
VKIDEVEPNIFPHVDDLDARDAGRHVEVFLDVKIESHGHGNRPSGQSSTTTRITATTAKVMAIATMVCWLTP